jgi:hypothetical protein
MQYRISEWARWIRLGHSAADVIAHARSQEDRAEVHADVVVLITFLRKLLHLISDPDRAAHNSSIGQPANSHDATP